MLCELQVRGTSLPSTFAAKSALQTACEGHSLHKHLALLLQSKLHMRDFCCKASLQSTLQRVEELHMREKPSKHFCCKASLQSTLHFAQEAHEVLQVLWELQELHEARYGDVLNNCRKEAYEVILNTHAHHRKGMCLITVWKEAYEVILNTQVHHPIVPLIAPLTTLPLRTPSFDEPFL